MIVHRKTFFLILYFFFFFLIFNVGPIGEIHSAKKQILNFSFSEYLFPSWYDFNYYVLNPFGYYLDYGYAKYLADNLIYVAFYKTSIIFISFILNLNFFKNFFSFEYTIFLCLLIFLSPNSDSLLYSSTHRYLFGSALVLQSYNFVLKNEFIKTFIILITSILVCYISVIYIFGLTITMINNYLINSGTVVENNSSGLKSEFCYK